MSQGEDLPIVDGHQHFWDLDRNYYPWLCDPVPIPFRYGDYSALRRNYLPPEYRLDTARHRIVALGRCGHGGFAEADELPAAAHAGLEAHDLHAVCAEIDSDDTSHVPPTNSLQRTA